MLDRRFVSKCLAERDMSLSEFASDMGLSHSIVSMWLSEDVNKQRNPTPKNIKRIADALDLEYNEITFDTADMAHKSLSRIERVAAELEASDEDDAVSRNAIKLDSLAGAYSKVYAKVEHAEPEKEEVDAEEDTEAEIQVPG